MTKEGWTALQFKYLKNFIIQYLLLEFPITVDYCTFTIIFFCPPYAAISFRNYYLYGSFYFVGYSSFWLDILTEILLNLHAGYILFDFTLHAFVFKIIIIC